MGVRRGAVPNGDRRFGERAGQAGASILETQEDDDDAEVVDEHVNDVRNTARWG